MPEFEFQMMENVWRMVADIHAEIPCAIRYTVHTVNVIASHLYDVYRYLSRRKDNHLNVIVIGNFCV